MIPDFSSVLNSSGLGLLRIINPQFSVTGNLIACLRIRVFGGRKSIGYWVFLGSFIGFRIEVFEVIRLYGYGSWWLSSLVIGFGS